MSSSVASIAAWQKQVRELVPSLSGSQAEVLGLISYGMIVFNSSGLTRLSNGLAQIEQVPAGRLRQRLREFYYEADAKRGKKRREVEVQACFGDLLTNILRNWQGEKSLALALDTSTLRKRFTVLNLSVLYRGCALPVAWVMIRAEQKGSWRPYWEGLLAAVAAVVPNAWKVIVTAGKATLRRLALDSHPGPGMAPDAAGEFANGVSGAGSNGIRSYWQAGAATWARVERERRVE